VEAIADQLRSKVSKTGDIQIEMGRTTGRYKTHWVDSRYDANAYGTKLLSDLVPNANFLFPKSLWNVYDCLYAIVGEDPNALVMDFFGGSGTTAHAVLELNKRDGGNRQFILCEQMEYVQTVTKERIRKVIELQNSGGFVYAELAVANEEFVTKIKDAQDVPKLILIWKEMEERAFLSHTSTSALRKMDTDLLSTLSIQEIRSLLLEVMDHNLLYVPLSEIADKQFQISEEDQGLNNAFLGTE
jgi:adenine-specific DNA-methyltransferase